MNNFFNNLKKEALNIKLSQHEKQAMRVSLYEAMQKAPAREIISGAQPSPARVVQSPYVFVSLFSQRWTAALAAIALIIFAGGGTAFASQGALPGDALYAIKVNVTEPAIGALAVGTEAKAQWNAQVAQTRLEEAETLAASGKLDATTTAQIAENFDAHSSEAQALAQQAEQENPGSGADITAQFDSSLEAHSAILARVGDESTSSKQFADVVVAHVREHGALAIATAQASGEPTSLKASVSTFAATNASPDSEVSPKLKKSAALALMDAKNAYNDVKISLDASTTTKIEAEFVRIGDIIDAATSTTAVTGALKDATVIKAFLQASKSLNRNLFTRGKNTVDDVRKTPVNTDTTVQSNDAVAASSTLEAPDMPAQSGGQSAESFQAMSAPAASASDQGQGQQGDGSGDTFVNNLLAR